MQEEKIERLKKILQHQAESYDTEAQLSIAEAVIDMYDSIKETNEELFISLDEYQNVYITKGVPPQGGYYPCVVAHLDQVHDVNKEYYEIHQDGDVIFALAKNKLGNYEQVGTGSDDLTGVWLTLELLLSQPILKVVWFIDEEVGCLGSEASSVEFFSDCSFVLQGDRRSKTNDFIIYTNGVPVVSKAFKKELGPIIKEFGYSFENGIATDVGQLVINGVGCCCANISCGYLNEHTDQEISLASLSLKCLNLMEKIISSLSYKRWEFPKQTPKPKVKFILPPTTVDNNFKAELSGGIPVGSYCSAFTDCPYIPYNACVNSEIWKWYCDIWHIWAKDYFQKNYGKDVKTLGVPDPYYYVAGAMWTWKERMSQWIPTYPQIVNKKESKECPVCKSYDVYNEMYLVEDTWHCDQCYTDISNTIII